MLAAIAPACVHVAVTLIVPAFGIVTDAGSAQSTPFTSVTWPFVITVFAWPTIVTTHVEADGRARVSPLIFTVDERPLP
jgi:hypothetical protein